MPLFYLTVDLDKRNGLSSFLSYFGHSLPIISKYGQIHIRIQPKAHVNTNININMGSPIRRLDHELLVITHTEVLVYVITTTLYPLILLEMLISRNVLSNKLLQYAQIESFVFTIAVILLLLNNAALCYVHLIVFKSFRRDVRNIFSGCYRKVCRKPPTPAIGEQHAKLEVSFDVKPTDQNPLRWTELTGERFSVLYTVLEPASENLVIPYSTAWIRTDRETDFTFPMDFM